MKKETIERFKSVIDEAHRIKTFPDNLTRNYSTNAAIITILIKEGIAVRQKTGWCNWVSPLTPESVVPIVVKGIQNMQRASYQKTKAKKKLQTPPPTTVVVSPVGSEEEAIMVLKASTQYVYEIYRMERVKL